ncbi:DUF7305 domain-containing protein [Neobacillus vireti]|uniref:DUF7305 domain-containing protein n=1 Tax=Neobacillus vireti TaxID=220686 RepID=UPI002FFE4AD6
MFNKRLEQLINNQQGIALVVVLMVFVVISVLGLSITGLAANNLKMSSGERTGQSTYYIAESGITYKMNEVRTNIPSVYNGSDMGKFYTAAEANMKLDQWISLPAGTFEDSFGQKAEATVRISKAPNYNPASSNRKYIITSKGTIDNRSRMVENSFQIVWKASNSVKGILNTAVLVDYKIDMSGNGGQKIDGPVATNASASESIVLGGNANITGNIYVGPNPKSDIIKNTTSNKLKPIMPVVVTSFILPTFPVFPAGLNSGAISKYSGTYDLTMDKDMKFTSITLERGAILNIDLGNQNRNLIVDQLTIPYGFINIIGSGKLTIYITNSFTMSSGSIINSPAKIDQLEIFYKGTTSLSFGGSTKVYGSLFVEKADITFSNGAGFQGHIVSLGNTVTFSGGTTVNVRLIYAPKAKVFFSGGANLSGSVVSDSIAVTGGSIISYGLPNIDNLSFFETSGNGGAASIVDITPVREK